MLALGTAVLLSLVTIVLAKAGGSEKLLGDIRALQEKIAGSPHDPTLHTLLGVALQTLDLQHHDGGSVQPQALAAYDRALSLCGSEPALADARSVANQNRGILLTHMGRPADAVSSFDAALVDRHPDSAQAAEVHYHKGQALNMLGELRTASAAYLAAIRCDRDYARAYFSLAGIAVESVAAVPGGWEAFVPATEEAVERKAAAVAAATQEQKAALLSRLSDLHFALFQYHDAFTKDRKLAWRHLASGNQAEAAARTAHDPSLEEQSLRQVSSVFTPGFWPDGAGSPDRTPIFVIGMMRSGSTLVEQILSAHPAVYGMGEDSVFNGNLPTIRDELVRAVASGDAGRVQDVVQRNARKVTKGMRARRRRVEGGNQAASRIVDKMLFNYKNVGFIHLLFPNATIIHTTRDPMDTLFSCYKHKFDDRGLEWSNDLEHLARFYRAYRAMMEHWERVLPGRIVHVRYEDLVADQEGVSRALVAACGLVWSPRVLEFHKLAKPVHTHSMAQVRYGITSKAVGGWRKYKRQLAPLRKALGKAAKRWDVPTLVVRAGASSVEEAGPRRDGTPIGGEL